jgi:ABC-type lipoprotein export system ATPase subunit
LSVIEVKDLSKEFQSGRGHVRALTGISFRVDSHARVAVVGKSGSGKTTLLNCIGGIERPEEGAVVCFGVSIHALSPRDLCLFQRRQVGFIFQSGNLISYLTVSENIGLPLTLNNIAGRRKEERIEDLLQRIGLLDARRALPHELSGGEVQRVSVARAIAHRPRMLLADEPTASLDSATGRDLINLVFEMGKEEGCTILVSTHDPEIFELADTRIRLRDGRIEK